MTNIEQIKRQMPYSSEDEKAYTNCQLSNERARGFNEAIDYLHSKGLLMVWQPIDKFDGGAVYIVGEDDTIMHRAIAYKCNNEWYVLNSNENSDGSELIKWSPTHWMPLPAAPEGDA